jgi:hypothetical protein
VGLVLHAPCHASCTAGVGWRREWQGGSPECSTAYALEARWSVPVWRTHLLCYSDSVQRLPSRQALSALCTDQMVCASVFLFPPVGGCSMQSQNEGGLPPRKMCCSLAIPPAASITPRRTVRRRRAGAVLGHSGGHLSALRTFKARGRVTCLGSFGYTGPVWLRAAVWRQRKCTYTQGCVPKKRKKE